MKVKAKKINNPNCDWLTEGKGYEVFDVKPCVSLVSRRDLGGFFSLVDDQGDVITATFKNCLDIEGDWTIITEPAKVR